MSWIVMTRHDWWPDLSTNLFHLGIFWDFVAVESRKKYADLELYKIQIQVYPQRVEPLQNSNPGSKLGELSLYKIQIQVQN